MKAAVWYSQKDVRVEERVVKPLSDKDVKVRVAWTGICGSDLHEYLHGPIIIPTDKPDPLTGAQAPMTLGHEFSGVVEEVGSAVTEFKVGDRVCINPLISNGVKPEELDIYDGFTFFGLGDHGGFADYAVLPEKNVYKLPDQMTLEEGALVEPAAVVVQALKEADLRMGQSVAIFGAGPIGLLQLIAAKAAGATKILVVDLSQSRLDKAKALGATHIINSGEQDPVAVIRSIVPDGVDVTFEVAGVEATFTQSLAVTRARGTVVIVSVFAKPIQFHPFSLLVTGIKITSSLGYEPTVFQNTIDLIASGQMDVKDVITGRIELDDIVDKGFEVLSTDKTQSKILVKLSGEQ